MFKWNEFLNKGKIGIIFQLSTLAMFWKSIEALQKFNKAFKHTQPFEFFFYADTEDAATNLSIALHQLGYIIHKSDNHNKKSFKYAVVGSTTPLETDEDKMNDWCKQMEQLALEYNCEFDGWGTLIE